MVPPHYGPTNVLNADPEWCWNARINHCIHPRRGKAQPPIIAPRVLGTNYEIYFYWYPPDNATCVLYSIPILRSFSIRVPPNLTSRSRERICTVYFAIVLKCPFVPKVMRVQSLGYWQGGVGTPHTVC